MSNQLDRLNLLSAIAHAVDKLGLVDDEIKQKAYPFKTHPTFKNVGWQCDDARKCIANAIDTLRDAELELLDQHP